MVQWMGTPASGVWLVALDVAALVAYRWLRGAVSERAWTHWIVLAKYPAFVAIVARATGRPVAWRRLLLGCALAFAVAQLYEREHNRALKSGASQ
jgi:chromate transport protein ChrA